MDEQDFGTPHFILRSLRLIVREFDGEIGVTLLVGGQWISGMLTSGRRYLDAVATHLRRADQPFTDTFADALEQFVNDAIASNDDDEPGFSPTVHLRRARGWIGGSLTDELPPMSIRADRIDAVFIDNPFPIPPEN